jgi:mannobiose 2-epimerase
MNKNEIIHCKEEADYHLREELLPFWLKRCRDEVNGGYITHFDSDGNESGENEKSLIAQTRTLYTMSSAHRAGYGEGACAEYARHGVDFLLKKMWDREFGGFFWMADRKGNVTIDKKILYGHSFAVYALSEYTLATGDPIGIEYAEKIFNLIQRNCADTFYGGYFEMFDREWNLEGPGKEGGDRKTLDVHMHLMEAFTTLYECRNRSVYKRKLLEDIQIVVKRMLHPKYGTGIPQFHPDWKVASQIKFDIVWGWDRFPEGGQKSKAGDNTSYGHNVEFAWLLLHALNIMNIGIGEYRDTVKTLIDHAVNNGIDDEYGGVYVEGPHSGGVYDREKEFWQQAEVMIGMLDACLLFGPEKYWNVYENVHRFVFDRVINHSVGEWWPLLTREGEAIWTHMSHSWKINYHTVRAIIQSIARLDRLISVD